ncbi:MAG: RNA polymerase sigma factor [Clostridia bacterium]|nr:RNA polymerase sigma factor [Clostridia bacterium]
MLRRARQGDPEAFESLMQAVESLIWRVCWHYTGHRESASDCAQEAILKIWRSLGTFRFDCAFESWCYRIAANSALDFLRKEKRQEALPLEPLTDEGFDPPDPAPGTEEQILKKEEQARLRAALAQLPEEQRDALVLTQLEGRSYEEAAEMLQVSEGTVKSRVNRARLRLRDLLAEGNESDSPEEIRGTSPRSGAGGRQRKKRREKNGEGGVDHG